MKRKSISKSLSILLAVSMVAGSAIPSTAYAADRSQTAIDNDAAEEAAQEEAAVKEGRAVYPDAVEDQWAQDPATVEGSTAAAMERTDGWLHMVAATTNANGTSAGSYPAVFVNPGSFDFDSAGFLSFDMKSESTKTNTRMGIYLGYTNPGDAMFLGYDSGGWFWQKYGQSGNPYYTGSRVPAPDANVLTNVRIDWTADKKATMTVNGEVVFEKEDFSGIPNLTDKIAIKVSGFGGNPSDIYMKNIHYTGQEALETHQVTGVVKNTDGQALENARVTINGTTVTTDAAGSYTFPEVADGTWDVTASCRGYQTATVKVTVDGGNAAAPELQLAVKELPAHETLSSDDMDVLVGKKFPSVIKYNMKGGLDGKSMFGQPEEIKVIKINGQNITVDTGEQDDPSNPNDVVASFTADTASYQMHLEGENVDCDLTMQLKVVENTVEFDITDVQNNMTEKDGKGQEMYPVQTIEIPNHSLVSVNSAESDAHLKGAKVSSNTLISGDKDYDVTEDSAFTSEDFMYGFVSNNNLSAGLWSNSQYEGTHVAAYVARGGASNTRVMATLSDTDAGKSMGLASTMWYYDRKITPSVNLGDNKRTETYVVDHYEMPSAKVAIAGDENQNGTVDWQDGAIVYRDIMHEISKSEEVPELVSQRIVENFASHAANPFLATLDGVKRVYLNTDGLGQSVLLKGYGSEGHDSGHPDYDDIGTRIGGQEDMVSLMDKGADLGARFGIHINASEMYLESKAFSDDLSTHNYGWNWLDQGIGINQLYDLGSGERAERLDKLYAKVGNKLDFIYLDVWGNGSEDAWQSRNIAHQITSKGWRFATEWGATHEYDSTMQHWAADLNYGKADAKGQNSEVMRFIRNHQKDSWIADYPKYNGAAQAPLLGGLNMTDFEGWASRTDYGNYIKVMFRNNVITKFLQHYKVMEWEDGEEVTMQHVITKGDQDITYTHQWMPEMKIVLKDDEKVNTVEVARKTGEYDPDDLHDFRSRDIKLNGVLISTGAATGGDGSNPGDEKYLVPWYWDADGKDLAAEDMKLYHWNTQGGDSEWTLPEGWDGLSTVKLYKLTDQGRGDAVNVSVQNGKISLKGIEAEVPYVIYKGEKAPRTVDWKSAPYITDTGFNGNLEDVWTTDGTGKAAIVRNLSQNSMLKLTGKISVTSEALTNLKAGQKYAVYVGVDNRSDSKAFINVKSGKNTLASNYAGRSIGENIVGTDQHHTGSGTTGEDGTSYFQNMFVFFTAPATGKVTLELGREAGDGAAYFDDIRVVETKMDVVKETDENGNIISFEQDFENNNAGIWPFVITGPGRGQNAVTDNRIHLSEKNLPYTKAGYIGAVDQYGNGVKHVDDVLEGNWSVKINGLAQKSSMIYQTIPQNFRFEPGVTYNITFKYQLGSKDAYKVTVGDGEFNGNTPLYAMPEAIGETKEFTFTLTGSETGQSWFGIYSTNVAANTQEWEPIADNDGKDGHRNFSGYRDFILDDLTIVKSDVQKGELQKAVEEGNTKVEQDYSASSWTTFKTALDTAVEILGKMDATKKEVEDATENLVNAISKLVPVFSALSGTVKDADGNPVPYAMITLRADNLDPIVITADAKGSYVLDEVLIRSYSARVTKEGYATVYGESVEPEPGKATVKDFTISVKENPDYFNYFDENADSIENLEGNPSTVTIEHMEYNGSGAVKATYVTERPSVVDTSIPKFKNGSFEADVTPLTNGTRVGLVMRANNHTQRLYVGTEDAADAWVWEYWDGSANKYSGKTKGPQLKKDVTSHIKMILEGNKMSLVVEGTEVFNNVAIDGLPDVAGYVGFNKMNGGQLIYDNIEVFNKDVVADTTRIEGTVKDADGNAVYNAIVKLKNSAGSVVAAAATDLNGDYHFIHIPNGSYTAEVTKDGYEAGTKVTIKVNGEETLKAPAAELGADKASEEEKAALTAEIAAVGELKEDDYTAESWKAVQDAVKAANDLGSDPSSPAVRAATERIRDAVNALQKKGTDKPSKEALNAKLTEAKAKKETDYKPKTWKVLQAAIAKAQEVADYLNATEAQINEQISLLDAAIAQLEKRADRTDLEKAIKDAQALNQAEYTQESWKALTDAIEAAELPDADVDQAAVDAAAAAIRTAVANLKKIAANMTALNAKLAEAKAIQIGNYTDASFAALQTAIASAEKVLAVPNTPQAQVDAQVAALANAISRLTVDSDKVAKAALQGTTVAVTAANTGAKTIKLSWKKIAEATGYQIMVKKPGKSWTELKKTANNSTLSYSYTKGTLNKMYAFYVRAYRNINGETVYSKYKEVKRKVIPQTPASVKASAKKGKITVSFKKVKGISGYIVRRKAGKGWSTAATLKGSAKSYVDKKIKKGKSYQYQVRAYKKVGKKKIYSAYSKTVKVKAK